MAQAKKPNSFNSLKLQKKKDAKPGPKKPLTRSQRIFRGPLFWIIAAIVAVTVFGQITNAGNQYTQIKTSQALDAISKSDVESAVLVDKEQKLRLVLKSGKTINGSSKVVASYVVGRISAAGASTKTSTTALAYVAGSLVIYSLGAPWLAYVTGNTLGWAIVNGVVPFLIGDAIKAVAAGAVLPAAWKLTNPK